MGSSLQAAAEAAQDRRCHPKWSHVCPSQPMSHTGGHAHQGGNVVRPRRTSRSGKTVRRRSSPIDLQASGQAAVFADAKPFLAGILDTLPLAELAEAGGSLHIADFGCAVGRQSVSQVDDLVVMLQEKKATIGRDLMAFFVDLPGNDFNHLFQLIMKEEQSSYSSSGAGSSPLVGSPARGNVPPMQLNTSPPTGYWDYADPTSDSSGGIRSPAVGGRSPESGGLAGNASGKDRYWPGCTSNAGEPLTGFETLSPRVRDDSISPAIHGSEPHTRATPGLLRLPESVSTLTVGGAGTPHAGSGESAALSPTAGADELSREGSTGTVLHYGSSGSGSIESAAIEALTAAPSTPSPTRLQPELSFSKNLEDLQKQAIHDAVMAGTAARGEMVAVEQTSDVAAVTQPAMVTEAQNPTPLSSPSPIKSAEKDSPPAQSLVLRQVTSITTRTAVTDRTQPLDELGAGEEEDKPGDLTPPRAADIAVKKKTRTSSFSSCGSSFSSSSSSGSGSSFGGGAAAVARNIAGGGIGQAQQQERPYLAAGVPGSFYGRLFPGGFLHFAISSAALQWLSKDPAVHFSPEAPAKWNPGTVWYKRTHMQAVKDNYAALARSDLQAFLQNRAAEMAKGGVLFLLMPGRSDPDPSTVDVPYSDILDEAWQDLIGQGLLPAESLDRFNMPVYYRSPDEVLDAIQSAPGGPAWEIRWLAARHITNPMNALQESTTRAKAITNYLRATNEPLVATVIGQPVTRLLFDRVKERLLDEPDRYPTVQQTYVSAVLMKV